MITNSEISSLPVVDEAEKGGLPPPEPANLSRVQIEIFAQRARERLSFDFRSDDLGDIVRHLGGSITRTDRAGRTPGSESDKSSCLSRIIVRDGKFEIGLDKSLESVQVRFGVAHELGHYFINYPIVKASGHKNMEAFDIGLGRADWEAQWFALSFLLPADQFLKECEKLGLDFKSLREGVGVSIQDKMSLSDIFKVEVFYIEARIKELIKWPGLLEATEPKVEPATEPL